MTNTTPPAPFRSIESIETAYHADCDAIALLEIPRRKKLAMIAARYLELQIALAK